MRFRENPYIGDITAKEARYWIVLDPSSRNYFDIIRAEGGLSASAVYADAEVIGLAASRADAFCLVRDIVVRFLESHSDFSSFKESV